MAHGVVTRSRMASEYNGNLRIAGKYLTGDSTDTETAIDNGNVVAIGSFLTGEAELRELTTPTATTTIGKIGIVTTPEVMADERKKNFSDFYNEAGAKVTVDVLTIGDTFMVTKDALSGTPAKDSIVEMQADIKLKVVATLTTGSTKVGKIVDYTNEVATILVG